MRHQAGATGQRQICRPNVQRVHRCAAARSLLGADRRRPELLEQPQPDQLRREGRRAVRTGRHLRLHEPAGLHRGVRLQRSVRRADALDQPDQLPDPIGRVRQRVPLRRQRPRHTRPVEPQLQARVPHHRRRVRGDPGKSDPGRPGPHPAGCDGAVARRSDDHGRVRAVDHGAAVVLGVEAVRHSRTRRIIVHDQWPRLRCDQGNRFGHARRHRPCNRYVERHDHRGNSAGRLRSRTAPTVGDQRWRCGHCQRPDLPCARWLVQPNGVRGRRWQELRHDSGSDQRRRVEQRRRPGGRLSRSARLRQRPDQPPWCLLREPHRVDSGQAAGRRFRWLPGQHLRARHDHRRQCLRGRQRPDRRLVRQDRLAELGGKPERQRRRRRVDLCPQRAQLHSHVHGLDRWLRHSWRRSAGVPEQPQPDRRRQQRPAGQRGDPRWCGVRQRLRTQPADHQQRGREQRWCLRHDPHRYPRPQRAEPQRGRSHRQQPDHRQCRYQPGGWYRVVRRLRRLRGRQQRHLWQLLGRVRRWHHCLRLQPRRQDPRQPAVVQPLVRRGRRHHDRRRTAQQPGSTVARQRRSRHLQQPHPGEPVQRRRRRSALPDGRELPDERLQQHDRQQRVDA